MFEINSMSYVFDNFMNRGFMKSSANYFDYWLNVQVFYVKTNLIFLFLFVWFLTHCGKQTVGIFLNTRCKVAVREVMMKTARGCVTHLTSTRPHTHTHILTPFILGMLLCECKCSCHAVYLCRNALLYMICVLVWICTS